MPDHPTLTEMLRNVAEASPNAIALVAKEDDPMQEYTYGELFEAVQKIAAWLCSTGIGRGDRVGLLAENRPEWCLCYFGILFSGAVAVPLDVQSSAEEIRTALRKTEARAVFTTQRVPSQSFEALETLETIVRVEGESEAATGKETALALILHATPPPCPLPAIEPEDLASIIFTSGTTGVPKGVMLSHKNFVSNFIGISKLEAVSSRDNFLSILPLHHAFPFMATLLVPLFSGARITYLKTLNAERVLRSLQEQGITILAATPQVLHYFYRGILRQLENLPFHLGTLLESALTLSLKVAERTGTNPARPLLSRLHRTIGPHFRYFISGGAKLEESVSRAFLKMGFEVLEGYGLTETSPVVSMTPPSAPKPGSVGKPLEGVEVRILKPDPDGVGEILVRGESVMKGYFKDAAGTREVFDDSWFRTGDLGRRDREGYLFVEGRLKDIIVLSSGKNVSAEEVNQHYRKAPSVKEISVLAGPRDEKLVAVVFPDFHFFMEAGESDITGRIKWDLETLSAKLEPYKRIRDFVITNHELPKTRLGKVKRHEVEALYRQRSGPRRGERRAVAEEQVSPVGRRVIEILERQTGQKPIALSDSLELDLGMDSLGRIELNTALEKEFGFHLPEEESLGILTVDDLIRTLEAHHPTLVQRPREEERSWAEILRSPPPRKLLETIGAGKETDVRFATVLSALLLAGIFRGFFDLHVSGRDRLEGKNLILCPNHASYLDGLVVFSALPHALKHKILFLGYSKYFESIILNRLVRYLKIIPVDSTRNLIDALQAAAFALRTGQILCIFPEGARTISGEIMEFKRGVGILAVETQVKLVPVFIRGTYEAWKIGTALPRAHPIHLVFGRPFSAEELEAEGLALRSGAKPHEAVTLGLREEMMKLKRDLER